MPPRTTRIAGLTGLALTVAAAGWLVLHPCAYRGVEAHRVVVPGSSPPEVEPRSTCATLVEVNGTLVLVILAIPVLLAMAGFLAVRAGRRVPLLVTTGLLAGFVLLTGFSVGYAFAPGTAAFIVAVLSWRRTKAAV